MHAPVFTELTATDAEGAHRLLTAAYGDGNVRFDPGGEVVFGSRRQDLGEIRLDEIRYSMRSEYDMDPLGYVLIVRVHDGELEVVDDTGTARVFGAGEVFLCAQPDAAYHAVSRTRHAQAVGIDLSLLERVSEQPADELVRRFGRGALTPIRARHWQRTVDYLSDIISDNEHEPVSPLVLGEAARLLAATAVSAFTAEPEEPDDAAGRSGSTESTVRRAVAFLEANPDLELGVAEIARATHVSVRTLQVAFRRHLETTPMAYLRRVRLDRVRADLSAAGPESTVTITQVAARWGFADPGRFSAYYRHAYGESPRATLHA